MDMDVIEIHTKKALCIYVPFIRLNVFYQAEIHNCMPPFTKHS